MRKLNNLQPIITPKNNANSKIILTEPGLHFREELQEELEERIQSQNILLLTENVTPPIISVE